MFVFGSADVANGERIFAEYASRAARQSGMTTVIAAADVAERLEHAGLPASLHPDPEQLARNARQLGCTSYLTADIALWRQSSFLFSSSARIAYRLTCHAAADGKPLWTARVERGERGAGPLEVAQHALRETFQLVQAEAARNR